MSTRDHIPITQRGLDDLVLCARTNKDWLKGQKFLRRIDRAIPGMTYPRHCAPGEVLARADEARVLFKAFVNDSGDVASMAKLQDLLAIEPDVAGTGVFDWQPTRTTPDEEEVAA